MISKCPGVTSLNLELGAPRAPNLAMYPVGEFGADVAGEEEEGDDVEAEVLDVVEVSRCGLEVFRPLRVGHVLQQPDGVVDGVVALQRQQVGHLVDVLLVAARKESLCIFPR